MNFKEKLMTKAMEVMENNPEAAAKVMNAAQKAATKAAELSETPQGQKAKAALQKLLGPK